VVRRLLKGKLKHAPTDEAGIQASGGGREPIV
jgi:hypothetical protein